jgi:hypothetical protein
MKTLEELGIPESSSVSKWIIEDLNNRRKPSN